MHQSFFARLHRWGDTRLANAMFLVLIPFVNLFALEWIHRGSLITLDFWQRFVVNFPSYLISWLLLVFFYVLVAYLTGHHMPAVLLEGLVCIATGTACYFKLQMRGEPFLPWDFSQVGELAGVASKVKLQIQPSMVISVLLLALLTFLSHFVTVRARTRIWVRATACGVSLAAGCALVFGVLLQPEVAKQVGIVPDMWMQDRYYQNYGVITGFVTNLTVLNIAEPEGYTKEAVQEAAGAAAEAAESTAPLFADSYAAQTAAPEKQPTIIYVMDESFWDVTRLKGISYDTDLTPNLARLKQEAAHGYCYSPSFGGGTCDVEFEALTGFSIEHLPAGCKPYQQHVTHDMFSLPQYLRTSGYDTLAIHGYYAKFWSRNVAYPYLGLDEFIAAEQFRNPDKARGFISDDAMADKIIEEYEDRASAGAPQFIHAVTMQNHTTYSADRYPADELVKVTAHPGLSEETISQLEDFATGVQAADAMLGKLTDYFSTVDEPVILVFWGDHFNPVGQGYELYEKTGYIEKGDLNSPDLHRTDLLLWSNYADNSVDIGTVAAYEISPVMMELYGLEKPNYFSFLSEELRVMRARTHGITVQPDGTYSEDMTEEQQKLFNTQWLLQYDYMFGAPYQNAYTKES